MEISFNVGDYVCQKEDLNKIYKITGSTPTERNKFDIVDATDKDGVRKILKISDIQLVDDPEKIMEYEGHQSGLFFS